jgi:hypothetical protein
MLPRVETYYPRGNSANAVCVELEDRTLWFSYRTLVAFQVGKYPRIVSENCWGPTTGRHLNAIDGGYPACKARVSRADFERMYASDTNHLAQNTKGA